MSEHGLSAYSNDGCRCDVCRAANATYKREKRRAARLRAQAFTTTLDPAERGRGLARVTRPFDRYVVPGVKHGSAASYDGRGCRCVPCTTAHRDKCLAAAARRRARARAAT